jgi:hypothetical protein
MDSVKIANLIITAALTIVGLYLAHSYRRQIVLRVAERRLSTYAALWEKMGIATPVRIATWNVPQPLTDKEREELFRAFNAWYYEDGNGMLVGDGTRTIYLRVKDNLVCPIEYYQRQSIREKLQKLPPKEREQARGALAIRQLSLLRTRMKADLSIYGVPYHAGLDEDDKALLRHCGEKLSSKPWARRKHIPEEADPYPAKVPLEASALSVRTEGGM